METAVKHLWEVDHPYYCAESNYWGPISENYSDFKSWQEFFAAEGDEDLDMNLIFRFDWSEVDPETDTNTFNGDLYYRNGQLTLFYMGQCKALYRYVRVSVCRADEPAVIEFLQKRWEHMKLLWEPLSEVSR